MCICVRFFPFRGESDATVFVHMYLLHSLHTFIGGRGGVYVEPESHFSTNTTHSLFTDTEKISFVGVLQIDLRGHPIHV